MAHFIGSQRRRGNNFEPRFSSFQAGPRPRIVRPPPPLMSRSFARGFSSSQDFVIGGGPIQDSAPPKRATKPSQGTLKARHFVGCEAAQRFPNAKEKLHNIIQGAMKGNALTFNGKQVENFWQCTVHLPWPRPMSFYGEGSTKREAERNVAAIACVELEVGQNLGEKIFARTTCKQISSDCVHSCLVLNRLRIGHIHIHGNGLELACN